MKKAIITGITGQDGSYLAELLLQKGYEATFILLDKPMTDSEIPIDNYALKVFIQGQEAYGVD